MKKRVARDGWRQVYFEKRPRKPRTRRTTAPPALGVRSAQRGSTATQRQRSRDEVRDSAFCALRLRTETNCVLAKNIYICAWAVDEAEPADGWESGESECGAFGGTLVGDARCWAHCAAGVGPFLWGRKVRTESWVKWPGFNFRINFTTTLL